MIEYEFVHPDALLVNIESGMPVYDSIGLRIGTVKYSQLADDSIEGYIYVEDQRVRNAPRTLRLHLLQKGYVCINTGLLSPDLFATTDQIYDVINSEVHLSDDRDKLLTL